MIVAIAGVIFVATVLVFLGAMAKAVQVSKEHRSEFIAVGIISLIIGSAFSGAIAFGYPTYLVWQQEQEGRAELAKAEQNRQIAIQEARAKEESAISLANAKRTEAQGIADANETIIKSLKTPELYIQYLWTEALKSGSNQTVYIPSNAGIPVTEANRLGN